MLIQAIIIGLAIFALWEAYVALWKKRIYSPVRHAFFGSLGFLAAKFLLGLDGCGTALLVGLSAAGVAVLVNLMYQTLLAYADERSLAVQARLTRFPPVGRRKTDPATGLTVPPPATVGNRMPELP